MKSKKIALVILAAMLLMAASLKMISLASIPQNDTIKMKITYGYNGNVKSGKHSPLKFLLENVGEEEFHGSIQVISKHSSEENYLYEQEVSLGINEQTEYKMIIPLSPGFSQLYAKLIDDNGKTVKEELIKFKSNRDSRQMLIGILSDNYEDLIYFDNNRLNDGELSTKTFYFNLEDVPEVVIEMNHLDLIIINDFDTSKLSEKQMGAIVDWVHNGGTLLIGTGSSAEKTLSGFDINFIDAGYSSEENLHTDLGVVHINGETEKNYIDIVYRELFINYGKVIFIDGDKPLITKETKERGIIGYAGFDLTEVSEYTKDNNTYVNTLLTELMTKKKLSTIANESSYGDYKYWLYNPLVEAGNTQNLANPNIYAVLLTIHVFLVGPLLYLFLKKTNRRHYYHFLIVVISLGGSFLIYILGQQSRFQAPFFNYVTIKEIESDYINEVTYFNVRAPFNEKYSVHIDPSYFIVPIAKDNYYYYYKEEDMNGEEKYNVILKRDEESISITVQDVVAFTSELFQLNSKTTSDEGEKFQCDMNLFDGKIYGTVSNHLGYDLEKAAIIMYGQVVILGDIQDGQTINLEDCEVIMYPINYTYSIAKEITGNSIFEKPEVTNPEYSLSFKRGNLLQHYIENYFLSNTTEARVVAFTKEINENSFVLDDKYDAFGITMISIPVRVDYNQEDMIYYPRLPEPPQVLSGDYLAEYNTAYGSEPVILEYQLGRDIDITKVTCSILSEEMAYSYVIPFSGNIYFFNLITKKFDKKMIDSKGFDKEKLEPYLSSNNTLTVKYEIVVDAEYQWDINLPILSVVGKKNDVKN